MDPVIRPEQTARRIVADAFPLFQLVLWSGSPWAGPVVAFLVFAVGTAVAVALESAPLAIGLVVLAVYIPAAAMFAGPASLFVAGAQRLLEIGMDPAEVDALLREVRDDTRADPSVRLVTARVIADRWLVAVSRFLDRPPPRSSPRFG